MGRPKYDNDMKNLAYLLRAEIRKEFDIYHLSGNLADTVIIRQTLKGWEVEIPAQKYDINLYRKTGEIRYIDEEESYAEEVNISGGFSGQHVDFVSKCINNAIRRWSNALKDADIKVNGNKI